MFNQINTILYHGEHRDFNESWQTEVYCHLQCLSQPSIELPSFITYLDLWKEWKPWCYEHRLSKSLFGLAIGQEGKWTHFTCSMPPIVTDQILSRRGIWSMVSLTFTNYENIVLIKRMSFQGMCSFVAIQYCS